MDEEVAMVAHVGSAPRPVATVVCRNGVWRGVDGFCSGLWLCFRR